MGAAGKGSNDYVSSVPRFRWALYIPCVHLAGMQRSCGLPRPPRFDHGHSWSSQIRPERTKRAYLRSGGAEGSVAVELDRAILCLPAPVLSGQRCRTHSICLRSHDLLLRAIVPGTKTGPHPHRMASEMEVAACTGVWRYLHIPDSPAQHPARESRP